MLYLECSSDRKYDGKVAATVKAYLTGGGLSRLPPYLAVKRIWEREPGNKYEDQMSSEQVCFVALALKVLRLMLGCLIWLSSSKLLCTGAVPGLPVH